jgi:hypothetical protein
MKTIWQLKNEGLISTHLYITLIRGITYDDKYAVWEKYPGWKVRIEARPNDLTVKDIFELWTDEEIMKWRGMGKKTFEELKGLI